MQSTRYFESVRYVTEKEERQRIMSGNVTVLFVEQRYRLNKYRDEGIVAFRAIAVFHLSYRYFFPSARWLKRNTKVWYKVLHSCGSALTPAALVAPGSRRHVRLSSTRPSSSNSTYGRLNSPPIRASAARRICGLSFLLFSSIPSFILLASFQLSPILRGAKFTLSCKSSCHQDMQPQFHIP